MYTFQNICSIFFWNFLSLNLLLVLQPVFFPIFCLVLLIFCLISRNSSGFLEIAVDILEIALDSFEIALDILEIALAL